MGPFKKFVWKTFHFLGLYGYFAQHNYIIVEKNTK